MSGTVFIAERQERRKAVPGYGGRYEVSDLGRVYSRGMEMSLVGDRYVNLSRNGEVCRYSVSYLVARAFLQNRYARPYVAHKDGDATNHRVENLAWSETKDYHPRNVAHKVLQYDLDGNLLARYESVKEASDKTGVARVLIRSCANGKARRAKKWIFRYV